MARSIIRSSVGLRLLLTSSSDRCYKRARDFDRQHNITNNAIRHNHLHIILDFIFNLSGLQSTCITLSSDMFSMFYILWIVKINF